jgi:tRNA threonylcarbamoyladenosine biosynthesis protein TsaE
MRLDQPAVYYLPDSAATVSLAGAIASRLRRHDAILLQGPLGAGKTEFTRALLRALTGDPALDVPSPTFTIVQEYETSLGTLFHFDLWRVASHAELTEIGWDDARDAIAVVEWPERLGPLTPASALHITLAITGEHTRRATLRGWNGRQPP